MPKFTRLDENDIVVSVNEVTLEDAPTEGAGIAFLTEWSGGHANWAQTTTACENPRKCYAGIGYKLDRVRNAFIPPQPYPSWTLDEATCQWVAPVAKPAGLYLWDEAILSWVSA